MSSDLSEIDEIVRLLDRLVEYIGMYMCSRLCLGYTENADVSSKLSLLVQMVRDYIDLRSYFWRIDEYVFKRIEEDVRLRNHVVSVDEVYKYLDCLGDVLRAHYNILAIFEEVILCMLRDIMHCLSKVG